MHGLHWPYSYEYELFVFILIVSRIQLIQASGFDLDVWQLQSTCHAISLVLKIGPWGVIGRRVQCGSKLRIYYLQATFGHCQWISFLNLMLTKNYVYLKICLRHEFEPNCMLFKIYRSFLFKSQANFCRFSSSFNQTYSVKIILVIYAQTDISIFNVFSRTLLQRVSLLSWYVVCRL